MGYLLSQLYSLEKWFSMFGNLQQKTEKMPYLVINIHNITITQVLMIQKKSAQIYFKSWLEEE